MAKLKIKCSWQSPKFFSLFFKPLRADTLVEVIISLLIIMIVFVMAIGIFTKITLSGMSNTSIMAQHKMNDMLLDAIATNKIEAQTLSHDSITYQQTISDYANYPDILILKVEASQNQKPPGKMQLLVKKQADEN